MKKNRLILGLSIILLSSLTQAIEFRPGCPASSCSLDSVPAQLYHSTDTALFARYARSLLPGVGIGLLSGSLAGMGVSDSRSTLMTLFIWWVEASVRWSVLKGLAHDYNLHQLAYNKDLMVTSAWVASWIGYLNQRGYL